MIGKNMRQKVPAKVGLYLGSDNENVGSVDSESGVIT